MNHEAIVSIPLVYSAAAKLIADGNVFYLAADGTTAAVGGQFFFPFVLTFQFEEAFLDAWRIYGIGRFLSESTARCLDTVPLPAPTAAANRQRCAHVLAAAWLPHNPPSD